MLRASEQDGLPREGGRGGQAGAAHLIVLVVPPRFPTRYCSSGCIIRRAGRRAAHHTVVMVTRLRYHRAEEMANLFQAPRNPHFFAQTDCRQYP